jgi:PAS domain S-box-containing protein
MEMEKGVRGYLLSGDNEELNPYDNGMSFIIQELQTLRRLTADKGEQQARITRLQGMVPRAFAVHGRVIEKRREAGLVEAARFYVNPEIVKEATEAFTALQDELNEFDQAARVRLSDLREDLERNRDVNSSLIFGGTGLTFIALIVAGLLVLRDIAERRRAEEALAAERNLLRGIMDTIPDLIFVKDLEGRYTRDNLAHRRHLGVASEEQVAGKMTSEIHPVELATRYSLDDSAVLRGERTMLDVVEPGRTADGRQVWLETTKMPLLGPDGRPIGIVGVSSDITQRRADEEKLKHFAAALQRIERGIAKLRERRLARFAGAVAEDSVLRESAEGAPRGADWRTGGGLSRADDGRSAADANADPGPAQAVARDHAGAAVRAMRSRGDFAGSPQRSRGKDQRHECARGHGGSRGD